MGTWRQLREELGKPSRSDPTIAEFAQTYLKEYCEVRNRDIDFKRHNLIAITDILGSTRLSRLSRSDAHRFVAVRSKQVSPGTVNRGLSVLKNMLSFAVDREYLRVHPLQRFKPLPEPQHPLRIMTIQEYRKLIDAVTVEDYVIGAYVAVLGETALRKAEGLRLKWSDIDVAGKRLTVGESKSGRPRYVPLTDFALAQLSSLTRVIGRDHAFLNRDTLRPWKNPRGPFDKGKKAAGLEWVRGFHGLRHFRATQWLANGVDVRTVSELLGHHDLTTTMRYVHFLQGHADSSVREAERREVLNVSG